MTDHANIPPGPVYPAFTMPVINPKLADLIPAYMDRRVADIVQMRLDVAEGSFEQVRRIAHRMKGTGTSYGMPTITDLARQIEVAAAQGDTQGLTELVNALSRYLDAVRAALHLGA